MLCSQPMQPCASDAALDRLGSPPLAFVVIAITPGLQPVLSPVLFWRLTWTSFQILYGPHRPRAPQLGVVSIQAIAYVTGQEQQPEARRSRRHGDQKTIMDAHPPHATDIKPPSRLERAVAIDRQTLSEVIRLLDEKRPLEKWPGRELTALRGALAIEQSQPMANANEIEKAARLRRHLFLTAPAPEALWALYPADEAPGRVADRIRADLRDLVIYGAGMHLTDYTEVARQWLMRSA